MKNHGLHLFNPANDLSLALDLKNYTPPPAAAQITRIGSYLPLWYGREGDSFISEGINERWYKNLCDIFGIAVRPWNHDPENMEPLPWGWSKYARTLFENLGFDRNILPDDLTLDALRLLSGRKTSVEVNEILYRDGLIPDSFRTKVITDVNQALEFFKLKGDIILKLPWSSSGRGQIRIGSVEEFYNRKPNIEGAIKRNGYLTAEIFHEDKIADFAFLFTAKKDKSIIFDGFSYFETRPNGDYLGNILESDEMIKLRLDKLGVNGLESFIIKMSSIFEQILGGIYCGPFGIDAMVLYGGDVVPCVEINLRMTMGHVSHRVNKYYIKDGESGRFFLEKNPQLIIQNKIKTFNGKLEAGRLLLTPESFPMAFVADLSKKDMRL